MIEILKQNQVFVFGSNLRGAHLGGAARQAQEQFGAEPGIGEGLTGQCYAFPSLDAQMRKSSWDALENSRDLFYKYAREHPDKEFLMTAVGTGIAGFTAKQMMRLFQDVPTNVILPPEWKNI